MDYKKAFHELVNTIAGASENRDWPLVLIRTFELLAQIDDVEGAVFLKNKFDELERAKIERQLKEFFEHSETKAL